MPRKDDDIDDILGDLLAEDAPPKRRNTPTTPTRRPAAGKGAKSGDDGFYSSLAAMADSDGASDVSDADVNKMAHSIGGLDDMDADLFGGNLASKSRTSSRSGKPTTPRSTTPRTKSPRVKSPARSETPTSPPTSARGSLKRKPVKPSTMASPRIPEHKPGTAPGKMSDLSQASENLKPNQPSNQRPNTAPKVEKKYDFGDFDPDDPLAGVLSSDEGPDFEKDRPRSATKRPTGNTQKSEGILKSEQQKLDSPRRRNNLMDRPPTRSGSNGGDTTLGVGESGMTASKPAPAAAKQSANIFSDDDGDLLGGMGFDEGKPAAKKAEVTHKPMSGDSTDKPARSVFDSLLGKGSGTATSLLEPKEKKQFVLDAKYTSSVAGSGDQHRSEEDDFGFGGSYQPSAVSGGSRPLSGGSRRSVRFQDDDDIFGLGNTSPRARSPGSRPKPPPGMDWLDTDPSPVTPAPATPAKPSTPPAAMTTKPPTPTGSKPDAANKATAESPKKAAAAGGKEITTPTSATGPSPRAWLGLESSDTDGEDLFKPKFSSARKESLPQTPSLTNSPSPRKKPLKKDPQSPKVATTAADNDDDDWLARARSRRQQMLSKDEGQSQGSKSASGAEMSGEVIGQSPDAFGQSMRVDLSSVIVETPKSGVVSHRETADMFTKQQVKPGSTPGSWESPRTALSHTVNGTLSTPVSAPATLGDSRLKFSAASVDQAPVGGVPVFPTTPPVSLATSFPGGSSIGQMNAGGSAIGQMNAGGSAIGQMNAQLQQQQQLASQQLAQQQQQQQFMSQLQQQQKSELLQQQTQLEQMLSNIRNQYTQVSQMSTASGVSMPSYSQISAAIELPESLSDAHSRLRKAELEKHYTESMLDSMRKRFEEEMTAVELSYKNRMQIIEESNRKKEARLREENESLMQQHVSRVRELEEEKSSLSSGHYRRLEEMERERAQDAEKLREQHRLATLTLKREHEEALERLATAKNQEINMVASAHDTSKSITAVVEQIQHNARDLGQLHMKVETWNQQGLDQREISLRSKDEQLKMLQERLTRQEEDNTRERQRLEELIARMETQLRDQTRGLEEERWKLKQDQSRADAQQRALEEERRMWLEQQARERVTVERARVFGHWFKTENYLDEQRTAMSQLSEERRLLVEERSKFQAEQKTTRERMHQESIKHSQAEADYEVLVRTTTEEKALHASRMADLRREEERVSEERGEVERERQRVEREREKLADQAHQIRQQSAQIDHMTEAAGQSKLEGERAMEEALHINTQMERREAEVCKQQRGVKMMEEHISQEKLRLAKEKKEVENLKSSSLCVNCRSPLNGLAAPVQQQFQQSYQAAPHMSPMMISPAQSLHLGASLPPPTLAPPHQTAGNPLHDIASSIASDRAVRMWKIQAIKDKEFLEEESIYLATLRHSPYNSTRSAASKS